MRVCGALVRALQLCVSRRYGSNNCCGLTCTVAAHPQCPCRKPGGSKRQGEEHGYVLCVLAVCSACVGGCVCVLAAGRGWLRVRAGCVLSQQLALHATQAGVCRKEAAGQRALPADGPRSRTQPHPAAAAGDLAGVQVGGLGGGQAGCCVPPCSGCGWRATCALAVVGSGRLASCWWKGMHPCVLTHTTITINANANAASCPWTPCSPWCCPR